jgi:hypothetical protein
LLILKQFLRVPGPLSGAIIAVKKYSTDTKATRESKLPGLGTFSGAQITETNNVGQAELSSDAAIAKSKARNARPVQVSPGLLNDFILDNLAFTSMRRREEEVTQAHQQTFEWIFKSESYTGSRSSVPDFTSWLGTNDLGPIYWITGKPGSGKSTLMSLLSQHRSTKEFIRKWAGGSPVLTAAFFFWTSGSREQRSKTGLLRYLLHQLLSENTELIPIAFPRVWQTLLTMTTKERIRWIPEWTGQDLEAALHSFMRTALKQAKMLLFIDGLDEFDGSHQEIIQFFKGLCEGENTGLVKLCLSSRPWEVFENSFKADSVPRMRLQDLNYDDMYHYVRDRLLRDRRTSPVLSRVVESSLNTLVKSAIIKANGVFLWSRLATNVMIENFDPQSGVSNLQDTLDSLPSETDDLFETLIFENKSTQSLLNSAALFQLVRAREVIADFLGDESANSLNVWEIAFALHEKDDEIALQSSVDQIPYAEALDLFKQTSGFVQQSSAGLLDIFTPLKRGNREPESLRSAIGLLNFGTESKVTYIHRTVRDWLLGSRHVYARLSASSQNGFDPHLRLLRSFVVRLKRPFEEPEHHRRLDDWWPDISLVMTHSRYISRDDRHLQRPFINELDSTIGWYWLPKWSDPDDHWARHAFGAYEIRMKAPPIREAFLCLAIKFGLEQYVREELDTRSKSLSSKSAANAQATGEESDDREAHEQEEDDQPTPFLSYATEFLCSRNKSIYPLSNPALVKYLLQTRSAINPGANEEYADFTTLKKLTPWLALLRHLRDAHRREWIAHYDIDPQGTERWAEIVELYINEGVADHLAVVKRDAWDPEITAVALFELLETAYKATEVTKILQILKTRRTEKALSGVSLG